MNPFPNENDTTLTSSLFELCSKKYTGTLFIKTLNNKSAQFVIEEGEITQFSFEEKRGMNAIDSFKNNIYTNVQFIEDYHFPLTSEATITCSKTVLKELGFKRFIKTNSQSVI